MKIQQFYIFLCCMIGLSTQYRTISRNKKNSDDNPAPWQVSLRIHGVHYCSGAIVTTNVIITAGDCIIDLNAGQSEMTKKFITVKVGSKNLYDGSVYQIEDMKFNGHDITDTFIDDLVIIKIKGSFDLTGQAGARAVSQIVYNGEPFRIGSGFNVSSWGYNPSTNNGLSPTLTIKRWKVISHDVCQEYFGDIYRSHFMFCMVSIDDNQENPCVVGDIGDPGFIDGKLIAIKSYKKDCKLFPNHPSVFSCTYGENYDF